MFLLSTGLPCQEYHGCLDELIGLAHLDELAGWTVWHTVIGLFNDMSAYRISTAGLADWSVFLVFVVF